MSFENYNTADNASWNLDGPLWVSWTSLTLWTGEGAKFPATNWILTAVQYSTPADPTTAVVKIEKIYYATRSWDVFSWLIKWFDWDTPTSFLTWDFIYMNVVSKITEDMQDEIERLEQDKLDSDALRNSLVANSIMWVNNAWDEVEIPNWALNKILTSTWLTTPPDRQDPQWTITWEIKQWPTNTAPVGWLLCDWTAVSRVTYADLFSLISTSYWVWDWSTTFNVPNTAWKVIVWKDWATFTNLWDTGWEEEHTLTIAKIPAHWHDNRIPTAWWWDTTLWLQAATTKTTWQTTELTWSWEAHNNIQPYLVINSIIKT